MTAATSNLDQLNESALVDLMQTLEMTQENMYSCEETYALLDKYVELVNTGEDAARLMPLVKNHLDACPGCHEHYEILRDIIANESA